MLHTNLCFRGVLQTKLKSGMCCPQNYILVVCCRKKTLFFTLSSDLQQTVWAVLNALSMFMFLVLQICIAAYLLKFLYIVVHLQHSYHPPEKLMMHGILALSNAHLFLIFDFSYVHSTIMVLPLKHDRIVLCFVIFLLFMLP